MKKTLNHIRHKFETSSPCVPGNMDLGGISNATQSLPFSVLGHFLDFYSLDGIAKYISKMWFKSNQLIESNKMGQDSRDV